MSLRTAVRGALGKRGFGWRRDPADDRDRFLAGLLGELMVSPPPTAASVRHELVAPKDQRATNACVGFSWSMALRLAYLRAGVICPDLSPLAIYYAARAEHGDEHLDFGSYLRAGARAIMRYGAPPESAWPFSSLRVNKAPSFRALHAAHDRRGPRGYFRIPDGDAESVRRAIAAGYPVVGGWEISATFADWTGGGVIAEQRGAILGGHAIAFDSYDGDVFSGPGSWSTNWGRSGRHYVAEGFIREGMDLWAVAV